MKTLQQILQDASAYLDLDPTLPTGTELSARINYANQAVMEAASTQRFKCFTTLYMPSTSTLASISLPSNFKELEQAPAEYISNSTWRGYNEIRPEERYGKESSDRYCYILGNSASGHTLVMNNMTANATLSIQYQRYPSGFATLTDVCELPDPEYVKLKLIAYVLQARSDDRFPIVDANANNRLKNMIGRESRSPTGGVNQVPRDTTFRIGE